MKRSEEKKLAMDMKNGILFDAADCRNLVIPTGDLCKAMDGLEIVQKALQLFHDTPDERIDKFTKGKIEHF